MLAGKMCCLTAIWTSSFGIFKIAYFFSSKTMCWDKKSFMVV